MRRIADGDVLGVPKPRFVESQNFWRGISGRFVLQLKRLVNSRTGASVR